MHHQVKIVNFNLAKF